MSLPMPAPGSRVGIVLRDGRELFGDMLPVKMMSGRWAVMPWGSSKTLAIDPSDVLAVDVVDLPPERIRKIAERQRADLDPNVLRGKRVGGDADNQLKRKRTMAGRKAKEKQR